MLDCLARTFVVNLQDLDRPVLGFSQHGLVQGGGIIIPGVQNECCGVMDLTFREGCWIPL